MSRKRNLWRGLTTLTASLLTVSVAAGRSEERRVGKECAL